VDRLMPGVKVRLNSAGVLAVLNDPQVVSDLERRGEAIKDSLPTSSDEEWSTSSFKGKDRPQVLVRTANYAARRTSAEDNALVRALDAGR
jgi:CRISPR/Cas system-associated protein Csm6